MIQIQQQCSHRNAPIGWKGLPFGHVGNSAPVSYNQYGQFLRQELEAGTEVFDFSRRARIWLQNHLILLTEKAPSATELVFISELFSSEEVPELAVWPERMPSSLIRHYVARGRALPASNPTAILREVVRNPLLSSVFYHGSWVDTWTETDTAGVSRLLYALSWKKETAMVARAA